MKRLMELIHEKTGYRFDIEAFCRNNRQMLIKVAAAALAVVAAFFVFASEGTGENQKNSDNMASDTEVEQPVSESIYVDIGGEVKTPIMAELPEGSRVDDAIKAAGGLTEKADMTDVNRAAFLEDGEKIYIPAVIEEADVLSDGNELETANGGSGISHQDSRVNINTADSAELQTLTGIGPATAQKIIDYRQENGRFSSPEDIKNVSGIGDKTFEKFKDNIKV